MIRIARIVNVLNKADNGIYGAHRVQLSFHNLKHEVVAYAKKLSDLDFLVEIVAALIGREIGLPIPEPVIAITQDGNDVLFASVDAKYPDLTRRLTICNDVVEDTDANKEVLMALSEWPAINQAIGFDEWIANNDRNIGNILYDGIDQYILIDHNQAMRLPFVPQSPIDNKLLHIKLWATGDDEVGRQRIKNTISAMIASIEPELPESIISRLLAQHEKLDRTVLSSMIDFLSQRLRYLTAITNQKIITKQSSL